MATLLRERPIVPQLSRWSKGVASLDFWMLSLCCHDLVLQLFATGLLGKSQDAQANGESLRDLLGRVDPGALEDTVEGFKALTGARLSKTFNTISKGATKLAMYILSVVLGALRYVSKFFQASIYSARAKAKHANHEKPPPHVGLDKPSVLTSCGLPAVLKYNCRFWYVSPFSCLRRFTKSLRPWGWKRTVHINETPPLLRTFLVCISITKPRHAAWALLALLSQPVQAMTCGCRCQHTSHMTTRLLSGGQKVTCTTSF